MNLINWLVVVSINSYQVNISEMLDNLMNITWIKKEVKKSIYTKPKFNRAAIDWYIIKLIAMYTGVD